MDVDTALIDVISALLGANLLGIYAYEPAPSAEPTTRALLVVTARDLLRDTRYGLAQTFLRHSCEAEPLEALVIQQADLVAQPSVLVQLHYTEAEREQLAAQVESIAWLSRTDGLAGSVDRAEFIACLQHTGRTIAGRPLPELLGDAAPQPHHPCDAARQLSLE